MREERMMILTMLQEEKISSEEAAKLLDALDEVERREAEEACIKSEQDGSDNASACSSVEKVVESFNDFNDFEEKIEAIGEKIGNSSKKLEDTMNKWGVHIGKDKTSLSDAISDMVHNIIEKNSLHGLFLGKYKTIEEIHEKNVSEINNPVLEFQGINGKIELYTWNKDNIFVEAKCQIRDNDIKDNAKIYEIIESENKITFKPKYTNNISIKLEVILPKKDYEKITLITTNGRIEARDLKTKKLLCDTTNSSVIIENIICDEISATTKNGKILISDTKNSILKANTTNSSVILENIKSNELNIITKNGSIVLEDIKGRKINLSTSNGPVKIENCTGETLTAKTSNASITVDDIDTSELDVIDLVTSNGKVDLNFKNTDAAFYVDAKTSMGKIDIGLPLVYEVNEQKQLGRKWVVGHSKNESERTVKVNISTSNGSIKIN